MQSLVAALAADLISGEPAGDENSALTVFTPLIGSWDLRFAYRRATGEQIEGSGYAHFGWGLEGSGYAHFGWGLGGLAIVDIWGFQDGTLGTRSTWICPARNALVSFVGRAINGRIVFNAAAPDPPGRRIRWSFVKIEMEQFSWTGEVSDDGTSWLLTQEIEGARRVGESVVDVAHCARD